MGILIYLFSIASLSLFCVGLRMLVAEGMIFHAVYLFFTKEKDGNRVPRFWISKPIITCPTCMASPFTWGSAVLYAISYLNEIPITPNTLVCGLGVCISSCFINTLLWQTFELNLRELKRTNKCPVTAVEDTENATAIAK